MIHGGDVYSEGLLKGRELLDFSSNINPLGVPESFKHNIGEALKALERYPDIKYRKVLKSLSDYVSLPEEYFVLGNGAAEIIDLVISCFKRLLIVVPSFAEYEADAKKWDCSIKYSYLKEDMDFDYEDILNKLQYTDALIIGNPNNPNGNIIDKIKLDPILQYCEEKGKSLIIDEAFIEFTGDKNYSFTEAAEQYNCLFIIRALTKFFAMPGIRFGYGVSKNKALLDNIRNKQNPWNINCFAELAVKYVLRDKKYMEETLKWIKEERSCFTHNLSRLPVIEKVYKTYSNYVLCRLNNAQGEELYNYCMNNAVVIRKAGNFKGLNDSYVRFAIKDRSSNEKLLKLLKAFKKEG